MTRLNPAELDKLEKRIQELKDALSDISQERWRGALKRDEKAVVKARIEASEKTLENCDAIANYLEKFSAPLSQCIVMCANSARVSLESIKRSDDAQELQRWIKSELIPPTKVSDRLGHLAVSSLRKARGEDLEFHRWSGHKR